MFINNFKNKNVIFIADSDLDGLACSILGFYFIKPVCKEYVSLNTADRSMSEIETSIFNEDVDVVCFADITPTRDLYRILKRLKKQVILIDHHETARELFDELNSFNSEYHYNTKQCACKILYDLFENTNEVVERFIEIVNCYDTWQDDSEDWEMAKNLNYLKSKYIDWRWEADRPDHIKNRHFINAMLEKFEKNKYFSFGRKETMLIRQEIEKENKYYVKAKKTMKKRVDGKGNKYMYIEAPSKLSIIGNKLLKENSDVQYAICRSTYYKAVENRSISLRSNGDFSVKEIAEKWGGGGHYNSAGLTIENQEDYNKLILGIKNLV